MGRCPAMEGGNPMATDVEYTVFLLLGHPLFGQIRLPAPSRLERIGDGAGATGGATSAPASQPVDAPSAPTKRCASCTSPVIGSMIGTVSPPQSTSAPDSPLVAPPAAPGQPPHSSSVLIFGGYRERPPSRNR